MTVFNTGMTDLEKRKRYLMDLLAEKLKSSKMSNYFPFANYRTITVFFLDKPHFSSCFSTSNVSVFDELENSKKENCFIFILVQILFRSFFRSERSSEKGAEDSDQNHGFLVEL